MDYVREKLSFANLLINLFLLYLNDYQATATEGHWGFLQTKSDFQVNSVLSYYSCYNLQIVTSLELSPW